MRLPPIAYFIPPDRPIVNPFRLSHPLAQQDTLSTHRATVDISSRYLLPIDPSAMEHQSIVWLAL